MHPATHDPPVTRTVVTWSAARLEACFRTLESHLARFPRIAPLLARANTLERDLATATATALDIDGTGQPKVEALRAALTQGLQAREALSTWLSTARQQLQDVREFVSIPMVTAAAGCADSTAAALEQRRRASRAILAVADLRQAILQAQCAVAQVDARLTDVQKLVALWSPARCDRPTAL